MTDHPVCKDDLYFKNNKVSSGHVHLTYPSVPVNCIMEFYTNMDFPEGKYSFVFLIKTVDLLAEKM